jgi:hypothetical protein
MKWFLIIAFYTPSGEFMETKAYSYQNKALCVQLLEEYKQQPPQVNAFGMQMRGLSCVAGPVQIKPRTLKDNDE